MGDKSSKTCTHTHTHTQFFPGCFSLCLTPPVFFFTHSSYHCPSATIVIATTLKSSTDTHIAVGNAAASLKKRWIPLFFAKKCSITHSNLTNNNEIKRILSFTWSRTVRSMLFPLWLIFFVVVAWMGFSWKASPYMKRFLKLNQFLPHSELLHVPLQLSSSITGVNGNFVSLKEYFDECTWSQMWLTQPW